MDNEESFFSSPKSLFGLCVTVCISLYFIYWLYNNIIKDNPSQEIQRENQQNFNQINNNRINSSNRTTVKKHIKQKLSINMDLLMIDKNNATLQDIKYLYDVFDKLSDYYNLYLIFHIIDEKNGDKIKENILNQLKPLVNDHILYEHRILFCSSIEGMSAIIRSLDSYVHIDNDNYIVIQLIRYINEFWFIQRSNNDKNDIIKAIKDDSNNAKLNVNELLDKIKFHSSIKEIIANQLK